MSQLVHGLIEALPTDEQSALAVSLNAAVVNVPTTVALNLIQNQEADIRDILALQTQLELIERIYPALDTAGATESASSLFARLRTPDQFRELIPLPPRPDDPDQSEAEDESDLLPEVPEAEDTEPAESTHVDVQS